MLSGLIILSTVFNKAISNSYIYSCLIQEYNFWSVKWVQYSKQSLKDSKSVLVTIGSFSTLTTLINKFLSYFSNDLGKYL